MLVGDSLGLAICRHGLCRERMSALAVRALLLPLQKLAEDRFALRARKIGKYRLFGFEECRELFHVRLLRRPLLLPDTPQHLLGETRSRPAWNCRRKIYVAPFRMPRRLAKLLPVAE